MMADGVQNQEGIPENFKERLAVAVRSIQWSYAIFWSMSTSQQGILEWGDGYYNGDIKTRKTVQAMELQADKIGLQRSEQLRELYGSLLEDETDQQAKRPSAALSPEDLSDAEWYYLVCMSFVFNPGQCLPGKALANCQPIWLCNAQYAESKVFSRSLLAKSASIQTVVCFPHLGGVIELGVTERVLEDPTLIQHIKTCLLELSKPICFEKTCSGPCNTDDDKDPMYANINHETASIMVLGNFYSPEEEIEFDQDRINELHGNIHEPNMGSPNECSNGCEQNNVTEDSFMLEGINGGASQVQSWHFMDDDFSNGAQDSINSSDCISQAFVNQENGISSPKVEKQNSLQLKDLQECNHTKLNSLDLGTNDDLHYRRTLSTILKSSNGLIEHPCFCTSYCKSCFVSWKKGGTIDGHRPHVGQTVLKKILFSVPRMHRDGSPCSQKETGGKDFLCGNENDKFLVLKSMVPSVSKIDKASILHDTIEYLKELEAKVEELESCMDLTEYDGKSRRKFSDQVEQISDNYDDRKIENSKKHWVNKRKASDIDEIEPQLNKIVPADGLPLDMKVSIKEQEVLIEMRCPWREYLLLDIMDAINNLHLDAHSVQSSNINDILNLTLNSKFRGTAVASAGMIEQALWKIVSKC
ncbi:transcription factor EGL1-like isoform X2 [Malania oleifera]|nr:transcription factor EGL1-like isoform X2 [Malania oleifera]